MTSEDAIATPGSVIELTDAAAFTWSTFGYVNSDHQIIPLTECGQPSIFEQKYCEDVDGLYHFQWSTRKGRIKSASVTVDGEKEALTCYRMDDSPNSFDRLYACIPVVGDLLDER